MVHSDGYGRTQDRLFPAQDNQNTARRELRQQFFSAEVEAVFASLEQFQIDFYNLIPQIALPNSICGTLAASPTGIQHLFSSRRLDREKEAHALVHSMPTREVGIYMFALKMYTMRVAFFLDSCAVFGFCAHAFLLGVVYLTACGKSNSFEKMTSWIPIAPNEFGHLQPIPRTGSRFSDCHHRLLTIRSIAPHLFRVSEAACYSTRNRGIPE